ncbi:MAG: C4-type zinc ribbon domain-containing protein [Nitrospirae bacterium YQR-1]
MLEEIGLLKEIQALDSEIIRIKILIEKTPKAVVEYDKALNVAKLEVTQRKAAVEKALKHRKDLELQAEEKAGRITKMKSRVNDLKSNKEYKTHLKEIEQVEKEKRHIEDDILNLMEQMESNEKALKKSELLLSQEQEKYNEKISDLNKEKTVNEKELEALIVRRKKLSKEINKEIYDRYLKLLTRKNGIAVVRAVSEICCGCNMNIPPQLYVEVMKNDRILACPQCGRILYFEQENSQ